ncbi:FIST N-terminal domain-containing protein [Plastorhodobacter daqingensis]|uniref:FIST N-terminal domain-containing protein n=1 Tax=Plastorhodobacter daqingensis TaxID=1387281 RepID=A0ABW2UIV8_9RHOB
MDTRAEVATRRPIVATVPGGAADLAQRLLAELAPGDPTAVLLFGAPAHLDPPLLAALASGLGAGCRVMGCSSAGEFACSGYRNDTVVAVGFPAAHFRADAVWLRNLRALPALDWMDALRELTTRFAPDPTRTCFGLLLIDGLSEQEEMVVATVDATLPQLLVLGGSAGDGLRFGCTRLILDGESHEESALFCLFETDFAIEEIIFDHFSPSATRMVVTSARPDERLILGINDEPAAEEYARLIGVPVADLGPLSFARHPLLVRIGGRHHVRAIREVTQDGALRLMSAIEPGAMLTLGHAEDLTHGFESRLSRLGDRSVLILAFDCILRRLALEQAGMEDIIARLFRRYNIAGFNTYGEQHGGVHVNQTFVGLAFLDGDATDAA